MADSNVLSIFSNNDLDEIQNSMGEIKTNDNEERNNWKAGSELEVYSKRQNKWYQGKIMEIFEDNEGEWLSIRYNEYMKQIQRYNDAIRPIALTIDWNHVINCIKHEMWPKLASVINTIIDEASNDQQ
eukprot:239937_1